MTDQSDYHADWLKPENDGVTHIWLSNEGNTNLGRSLYIGAKRPFVDPVYGQFDSIIAFLVWYDNGRRDSLREIHHDVMIRSSMAGMTSTTQALSETVEVLKRSILSDPLLREELKQSTLPFATYEYVRFGARSEPSVYPLTDREWYAAAIEDVRRQLQQGA